MSGRALPERIPEPWARRWLAQAEAPHPMTLLDAPDVSPPLEADRTVNDVNRAVLATVAKLLGDA
jgi:hypothetical protein